MRFPIHFFPENPNIDFIGKRWWGFIVSGVLTVLAIASLFTHGLNLGIDFTGGVLMEVRSEQAINLDKMRSTLPSDQFGEVNLQNIGGESDVMIRVPVEKGAEQAQVVEKVKAALGEGYDYRRIDFVGPAVGEELTRGAIIATCLSLVAIALYIWFRFEWQFGLGAIAALIHDAAMMIGFFAVTQYEFGLNAIAAVLTIIGYSVNDSVVIYDRIRENMRKYKKMPLGELINRSMNETLSRALMTHLMTLLACLALVLFGGEVLRGFSASLAFGVIVGAYSSVFISAPMLVYLKLRPESLRSQPA